MRLSTNEKKLYEAMFLVDSALAASDWEGVNKTVKNVLARAGAEVVSIEKWDDRRLAYEVKGKTRGTYILSYFNAEPGRVNGIGRDVQLSEQIMRVLVLRAETGPGSQKQHPAENEQREQKARAQTERIGKTVSSDKKEKGQDNG